MQDLIRVCVSNEKHAQKQQQFLESQQELVRSNFNNLQLIHNYLSNEEIMLNKKRRSAGEIYCDLFKQKHEFQLGQRPHDVMEDFIDEELKEYMRNKQTNALLYDSIIQKYTSGFNMSKRKKRKKHFKMA